LKWAPRESMQFGRALQRILTTLVHAHPRYGPVHMAKIDVADGFYRVWVQVDDVPKLGVVLPTAPGNPTLIAFPLALPMGWVESPPYFTALTETACDRANAMLSRHDSCLQQEHRLEGVAATPPDDAPGSHSQRRNVDTPAPPGTQRLGATTRLQSRRIRRRFHPDGADAPPTHPGDACNANSN
jgi:hypothetical protein